MFSFSGFSETSGTSNTLIPVPPIIVTHDPDTPGLDESEQNGGGPNRSSQTNRSVRFGGSNGPDDGANAKQDRPTDQTKPRAPAPPVSPSLPVPEEIIPAKPIEPAIPPFRQERPNLINWTAITEAHQEMNYAMASEDLEKDPMVFVLNMLLLSFQFTKNFER